MRKYIFDISLIVFFLPILLPFFLVLMILVAIKLGFPIFFKQFRPGLGEKPFQMIKFRSMTSEVGQDGKLLPDEIRLTSFGKFLRSTSLDELPEIWHVIKGEMSLVGPRPLLMEYLPLYDEEQKRRHLVRPGITGWAQINGRNAISWEEKFKLDVWYVDNRSFGLDLKILFLTVKKVFMREGISSAGEATTVPFKGSNK